MSDFDQWGYPVHRDEPSTPEWSVPSPPTKAEREQERKESELARLRRELAEDREAIRRLLAVLPDSEHEDDESWSGCWDWLDDAAQEAVKEARNLPAVRRAIGGA